MLTPLQGAQFAAATSTMQSLVETLEERQREEADKAAGRKRDETPQAAVRADESARKANARINEHFFGGRARDHDTIAKLIARFSDALGLAQQKGETSRAFAQRLADAVTLADAVSVDKGQDRGQTAALSLKALGTTLEAVRTAMGGGQTEDANALLVARLARANDVAQEDGESDADFSERLNALLGDLRGRMPKDKEALEEQTGLKKLGLKAEDLIAAIRNPYGEEAQRVKGALAEKAEAEKALTPEMRKTLARLEDIAQPKSIEDLKIERTRRDPTRVEDAETRAEREDTIRALEAGEKLEDVRDLQDAVREANRNAAEGKASEAPGDPTAEALETIQILAAGVAAAGTSGTEAKETDDPDKAAAGATESTDPSAETTEQKMRDIEAAGLRDNEAREDARKDVFRLRVDENGIYDLITRQLVA